MVTLFRVLALQQIEVVELLQQKSHLIEALLNLFTVALELLIARSMPQVLFDELQIARHGTDRCHDIVQTVIDCLSLKIMDELKIQRSEEHTSELQSRGHLVCRLLLEKKNKCKT